MIDIRAAVLRLLHPAHDPMEAFASASSGAITRTTTRCYIDIDSSANGRLLLNPRLAGQGTQLSLLVDR